MSDEQIMGTPVPEDEGQPGRKGFDKGFKRNVAIIGGAILVAVIATALVVFGARSKMDSARNNVAGTTIPSPQTSAGTKPAELTQLDEARLGRVQTRQSDDAQAKKDTYIPSELPLKSELRTPDAQTNGPGRMAPTGYSSGLESNAPASDPARDSNIRKGIELQLAALIEKGSAPTTQVAAPYVSKDATAAVTGAAGAPTAGASAAAAEKGFLVKGLTIAGARLVSPLDTAKSEFVSAVITTGQHAGAYLIGKGKMIGEEGVLMSFTRMKTKDDDYTVDVTALDNATSSDAMAADIDRKLVSRYVIPVIFTTAQAYLGAIARPAQSIVATGIGTAAVVTPAAVGREAAAAGLSAGIGKAGEGFGQQKPSAYIPVDTAISVLFNTAVPLKVAK